MSTHRMRPKGPLDYVWWWITSCRWPVVSDGGRVGSIIEQLRGGLWRVLALALAGVLALVAWQVAAESAGRLPVMTRDTGPRVVGIPSDSETVED